VALFQFAGTKRGKAGVAESRFMGHDADYFLKGQVRRHSAYAAPQVAAVTAALFVQGDKSPAWLPQYGIGRVIRRRITPVVGLAALQLGGNGFAGIGKQKPLFLRFNGKFHEVIISCTFWLFKV
jgi:hypothetical protein